MFMQLQRTAKDSERGHLTNSPGAASDACGFPASDQTLAWPLREITWSVRTHRTVSTACGGSCTGQTAQNYGPLRQRRDNTTFRLVRLGNKLF